MADKHEISRRRFLEASTAAAIAASGTYKLMAGMQPVKRPNILFLMDDQHRGDTLGVAGHPVIHTPNIDRLAKEGAYFPKAHCSVPSCIPARASILTGLSPWDDGLFGVHTMALRWPFEQPRAMHDDGYYAMTIGKNHFHPMRNLHGYDRALIYDGTSYSDKVDDYGQWLARVAPGVDEHSTGLGWNDRGGKPWPHADYLHPTSWTGQQAVDFINDYHLDRPFFLKVSFHRPHSPYDPIHKWFDYYGKMDLPKAKVGKWAEELYGSFTAPQPATAARANLGDEVVRNSRQGYYGSISHVDEQIGRVIAALTKRGWLENTLIVFFADHGDMIGDQHLWRKTYAYEGSSRIPMIVRWGSEVLDAPRGQVLPQLTELRDVLPTFLDAAGVAAPSSLDGKSLLNLIRGKTSGWPTQLDMEHSMCYFNENVWTALTDGKFKYIFHSYDCTQQLFDIENDPHELDELSRKPEYAKTLAEWRQRMIDHLSVRGPKWVKDGQLVRHTTKMPCGPNFPGNRA
jgi:choline-sulfatase